MFEAFFKRNLYFCVQTKDGKQKQRIMEAMDKRYGVAVSFSNWFLLRNFFFNESY